MGTCELTGREFIYNVIYTECVRDDDDRVLACYVSPHRWDRSSCPYKHEYRENYRINEYANEKFANIDDLLAGFQRRVPYGYTVVIYKDLTE